MTGNVILDVEYRGIEDRMPTKGLLWFSGFPALWTSVSLFIYNVNDASVAITESKQTRTNWPRKVRELILDSVPWSQGVKGWA